MDKLSLKARAKINLALDVIGRRENGYHDVRMIMQSIALYDLIHLEKTSTPGITFQSNLSFLPKDEGNLAVKAAKKMWEAFELPGGLSINIRKCIPVAAGLAGGSTDAASVLYGIRNLYRLPVSMEELCNLGLSLGADVPFCLMRGTMLAEGIGEKLTRLPSPARLPLVLVKPPVSVSTKTVYESLVLSENTTHPDVDAMIQALSSGDTQKALSYMGNTLADVTEALYPTVASVRTLLLSLGATHAMMSGSGPTVFAFFSSEEKSREVAAKLRTLYPDMFVFCSSLYVC